MPLHDLASSICLPSNASFQFGNAKIALRIERTTILLLCVCSLVNRSFDSELMNVRKIIELKNFTEESFSSSGRTRRESPLPIAFEFRLGKNFIKDV